MTERLACWGCARPAATTAAEVDGYVRCDACGLRYAAAGVAPRERYDDAYFAAYRGGNYFETEPLRRHEARVRLELVRTAAGDAARDLLEVGCAAGFHLDEARALGWRPRGIEPATGPAEYARRELGLDVVSGFAEDVPLDPGSVDAVCLWHTLEHIPRPARLLDHLRAALRPGGVLLIEVPNAASRLAKRQGSEWFALEPEVHVAQWTPPALRALLERAGYDEIEVSTVPFLTYVDGPLHRFIRRVYLALRQRRWIPDPHPTDHELLRAVARRPLARHHRRDVAP